MIYPISVKTFRNVTIGYFDWKVDNVVRRVVRVVGFTEDGRAVDRLFKLGYPLTGFIDGIIEKEDIGYCECKNPLQGILGRQSKLYLCRTCGLSIKGVGK